MYGGKRPYGYVYGGSGGAFRVIGQMESTRGVWDGAVPYVLGTPMAIPNMFTPRIQALRVLQNSLPRIVDAMEPGGSGDVYKGLNARETAVLREAELMGFPMTSWFGYRTMGLHGFAALYGGLAAADPTYFLWTKPGYLGHDHPEYFAADRIQHRAKVAQVITAGMAGKGTAAAGRSREEGSVDHAFKGERVNADKVVGFRLATNPPPVYFLGGDLLIRDGEAAGKRLMVSTLNGDVVTLGVVDPALAAHVKPGDEVEIGNSNFLAMETYHRHQVPGPDYAVWNQFRTPDDTPVYPQRSALLGPIFLKATAGSLETGPVEGKMIAVASLWDREAFPWQADWYRQRVRANLGGRTDDSFRLWYTDHALHGDAQPVEAPDRIVSYIPVLQQALRDLAAWVEQGVEPPATTGYKIADGKVIVPAAAEARRGIQPVVSLRVNGGERVEVGVG